MKILNGLSNPLPSGVCSTASATVAKSVTINNYALNTGDIIVVTFTQGNSALAITLSVNGSAAKKIRLNNTDTNAVTCTLVAGAKLMLVYDGTYFHMQGSQRLTDEAGSPLLYAEEVVFGTDDVTQTFADASTLVTTFNVDGTITEVHTVGATVITRTTTFNADGSISEVIS